MKALDMLESMLGHVIEGYVWEDGILSFQLENGLTYHFEQTDDGINVSASGSLPN